MDTNKEHTLREAAGVIASRMSEVFMETEVFNFNVQLTGFEAKRVASICEMMKLSYGTPIEETLNYIVSVGLTNIRGTSESNEPES